MNKHKVLLILQILSIFCIFFFSAQTSKASETTNISSNLNDSSTISTDAYESNVHKFKRITAKKLDYFFSKKDDTDRYVYIGRPSCYYCRQFSPVLKKFNHLIPRKLYYLNTDADQRNKDYAFNNLQIPGTPTVIHFKNGEIISAWVGGGISAQELYSNLQK